MRWLRFDKGWGMLQRMLMLLAGLTILPLGCTQVSSPPPSSTPAKKALNPNFAPPSPIGYVKGHSWGFPGFKGMLTGPDARDSLAKLKETGAEWICLSYAVFTPSTTTPILTYGKDHNLGIPDEQMKEAIATAHELGLKVILKPMVQCGDGKWRAEIGFKNAQGEIDLAAWAQWWQQHRDCLVHYGEIAAETGCEVYCLGCELNSTEPFEDEWRTTIRAVREKYRGVLTYDVNFTIDSFPVWFDSLDLIGLSAYYHIGVEDVYSTDEKGNTEVDWEVKKSVEAKAEYMSRLADKVQEQAERFNLPVLFIETGVCSAKNASRHPWRHPNEVEQVYDGQEQADFYEAMYRAMANRKWFIGFCWWSWPAKLPGPDKAEGIDFTIHGKPAEQVVRQWNTSTPDTLRR